MYSQSVHGNVCYPQSNSTNEPMLLRILSLYLRSILILEVSKWQLLWLLLRCLTCQRFNNKMGPEGQLRSGWVALLLSLMIPFARKPWDQGLLSCIAVLGFVPRCESSFHAYISFLSSHWTKTSTVMKCRAGSFFFFYCTCLHIQVSTSVTKGKWLEFSSHKAYSIHNTRNRSGQWVDKYKASGHHGILMIFLNEINWSKN